MQASDREKLQALLDGKHLVDKVAKSGIYIDKYSDQLQYTCDASTIKDNEGKYFVRANLGGSGIEEYEIYEEPKWYENIPEQGVLCKVWDSDVTSRLLTLITSIAKNPSGVQLYKSVTGCPWLHAEPVQLADLEPYILKG